VGCVYSSVIIVTGNWWMAACQFVAEFNTLIDVGFEVLIAVVMKSSVFCDIMLVVRFNLTEFSEENIAFNFREKISQTRDKHQAGSKQSFGTCSSETSARLQWTVLCYNPEDRSLQLYICLRVPSIPILVPPQPPVQRAAGDLFPEVKLPEHEVGHLLPLGVQVRDP
jgi:hypothetical protein